MGPDLGTLRCYREDAGSIGAQGRMIAPLFCVAGSKGTMHHSPHSGWRGREPVGSGGGHTQDRALDSLWPLGAERAASWSPTAGPWVQRACWQAGGDPECCRVTRATLGLFQTLWFDLQQRLSDDEGTNMVRPLS